MEFKSARLNASSLPIGFLDFEKRILSRDPKSGNPKKAEGAFFLVNWERGRLLQHSEGV
jgi:hypothetical protein